MKYTLLLIFRIYFSSIISAQINISLLSAGGDLQKTDQYQLLYSIAEPIVGAINSTNSINQGFIATLSLQDGATAIKQKSLTDVSIFPNPFIDKLTIKDLNNFITKIEIYNSLGNLVVVHEGICDEYTFSMMNYPDGIYIISLYNSQKQPIQTTKIIKHKH